MQDVRASLLMWIDQHERVGNITSDDAARRRELVDATAPGDKVPDEALFFDLEPREA